MEGRDDKGKFIEGHKESIDMKIKRSKVAVPAIPIYFVLLTTFTSLSIIQYMTISTIGNTIIYI